MSETRKRVREPLHDDPAPDAGSPLASPAADRLRGYGEIAEFWLGVDTESTRNEIMRLVHRRLIPTGKEGGKVIASKRVLAAFWEQQSACRPVKAAVRDRLRAEA